MNKISITHLDKYQLYKHKQMVWFKWYIDAIQDYKFMSLSEKDRFIFISLVGLACKSNNSIVMDSKFLERILNTTEVTISLDNISKLGLIVISKVDNIDDVIPTTDIVLNTTEEVKVPKDFDNLTIIQKTVLVYKKLKGFNVREDKDWDNANFGMCAKYAKIIATCFNDDFDTIKLCMKELSDKFINKGLDWSIKAIASNCYDWRQEYEKDNK